MNNNSNSKVRGNGKKYLTIFVVFLTIVFIVDLVSAGLGISDSNKPKLEAPQSNIILEINETLFNVNNSQYLQGYTPTDFWSAISGNATGGNGSILNDTNTTYNNIQGNLPYFLNGKLSRLPYANYKVQEFCFEEGCELYNPVLDFGRDGLDNPIFGIVNLSYLQTSSILSYGNGMMFNDYIMPSYGKGKTGVTIGHNITSGSIAGYPGVRFFSYYGEPNAGFEWYITSDGQNLTIKNSNYSSTGNYGVFNVERPINQNGIGVCLANGTNCLPSTGGNSSFNQTLTDSLYRGLNNYTNLCQSNGTGCSSSGMDYTNLALTNQSNTFTGAIISNDKYYAYNQVSEINTQSYFCDFILYSGSSTLMCAPNYNAGPVGSGTQVQGTPQSSFNIGVHTINSGTAANNGYYFMSRIDGFILNGTEEFTGGININNITNWNQTIRLGFHDTITTTEPSDGVYFNITNYTATPVVKNTSNINVSLISYTVLPNTYYKYFIRINNPPTSATFQIYNFYNNSLLYNQTINNYIPNTVNNVLGSGIVAYTRSTSAGVKLLDIDYLLTEVRQSRRWL